MYIQEALSWWHVQLGANASHNSVPMSIEHFRDSDNAIRAKIPPRKSVVACSRMQPISEHGLGQ